MAALFPTIDVQCSSSTSEFSDGPDGLDELSSSCSSSEHGDDFDLDDILDDLLPVITRRRWECPVCCRELRETGGKQITLSRCGHSICQSCARRSVELHESRCPTCDVEMADLDVAGVTTDRQWVEAEQRRRWRAGGCQGIRCSTDLCPGVIECTLPADSKQDVPQCVLCQTCEAKYCAHCQVPWTSSHQCEQSRQGIVYTWEKARSTRDVLAQLSREQKHKPCPTCGVMVIRDGGCNMISCPNCRQEWCFACRGAGGEGCTHFVCAQA